MTDMNSSASENAVTHDSGWVADGHRLYWHGEGAYFSHPAACPAFDEGRARTYMCSPGMYALRNGVSLSDLPQDEADECRRYLEGHEDIRWRVQECIHPDLSVGEQDNLTVFEIELDNEDERND